MLGPFTFTFTLESEEFEKSEKVGAAAELINFGNGDLRTFVMKCQKC